MLTASSNAVAVCGSSNAPTERLNFMTDTRPPDCGTDLTQSRGVFSMVASRGEGAAPSDTFFSPSKLKRDNRIAKRGNHTAKRNRPGFPRRSLTKRQVFACDYTPRIREGRRRAP